MCLNATVRTTVRTNGHGLSERDCNAYLETQLAIRISHPALTQKIDISDSRAVIQYVERLHTTCSFQLYSMQL